MDDIFVSYTEKDVAWATWIGEVIEAAGRTCALQEWDSLPGGNFVVWINEQLSRARWVMPVYSPAYFTSKWCTTEWTSAMARAELLPVMVEPCTVPAVLSAITYANISAADETTARENLIYAIRAQSPPRKAKFGFPGKKTAPPQQAPDEKAVVGARWAKIAGALTVGMTLPEARTATIAAVTASDDDDDFDDSD
ncbi:toll/interleukin-1 receptor domain-containing protein [Streptomyces sp. GMY02]|uniref:toll/interleukin-1 receptor domain-containing protein n=1 Tax=Streptomyces sp. GMY02 TaxID=1333528 RepID=UPI001C2CB1D8|nr:toll/interleukin-1 receptor domain-containing protein [Streptomyces sp. GMY02]QXE35959.1 toll/interleukin-1 receptor domain-containing protein [Streptomyces sp. GMY02]